jgi:hypothetical protein
MQTNCICVLFIKDKFSFCYPFGYTRYFIYFNDNLSIQLITKMSFGQLIIGPPGSGKTTYCLAMKEYYEYFGRQTLLINLDPANDIIDKV